MIARLQGQRAVVQGRGLLVMALEEQGMGTGAEV